MRPLRLPLAWLTAAYNKDVLVLKKPFLLGETAFVIISLLSFYQVGGEADSYGLG